MIGRGSIRPTALGGLTLTLTAFLIATAAVATADVIQYDRGDPRVGWNLVTWEDRSSADWESAIDSIYATGASHVSIVTYRFNEYDDSTSTFGTGIGSTSDHGYAVPDDTAIGAAIDRAQDLNMHVSLNPFVEVDAAGGIGSVWRGNIGFNDDTRLSTWFANYTSYMTDMANLAEQHGVDRFSVGSELQGLSLDSDATAHWDLLIADVRSVYSGELTYAANWNWEYENVPFWDALDTIGVDAYFELTSSSEAAGAGNPTVDQIVDAWLNELPDLESYSDSLSRDIWFSEIGYTEWDETTTQPWNWKTSDVSDPDEQLNAYKALLEATDMQGDWLDSLAFWHWGMPGAMDSSYAISPHSQTGAYMASYTPEPGTFVLLGIGLAAVAGRLRRRSHTEDEDTG
jgi:hypothetical protein